MRLFDCSSYQEILKQWLHSRPAKGYGEVSRVAEFLSVQTSFVSQVLSGNKEFSYDQGCGVCEYIGLTELETEYFLTLLMKARAATQRAQNRLNLKISEIQAKSQEIKSRVRTDRDLTAEEKAIFYSHWAYATVQLATAIPGLNQVETIADHLNLPRNFVAEIVAFLVATGLCAETKQGLVRGAASTHVDAKSPHVTRHHQNWRIRGLESLSTPSQESLFFTFPLSLSKSDYLEIRKILVEQAAQLRKFVEPSKDEVLACINFDLFKIAPPSQ